MAEDVFEKGGAAFESGRSSSRLAGESERKMASLEDRLRRKDEVIAQTMEDLVLTETAFGNRRRNRR